FDQLYVCRFNVRIPLLLSSFNFLAAHCCLQHSQSTDCILFAKSVAAKNFVFNTRLGLVVINHVCHVFVTNYQSSLYCAVGHSNYRNASHTDLLDMACEVDVVISETFCCNESSVYVHHFYGVSNTFGYIELLCVDLWASYKYNAAEVNFRIMQCFQNQRLSPVMSGHLFRSRSDTGQRMDTSIQNLQRR